MRQVKSAGVSSAGFQGCHQTSYLASFCQWNSQHRVHSSGSRLGEDHAAAQTLLPCLIFHPAEQNPPFLAQTEEPGWIKGLLEPQSCLLTFTHPAAQVCRIFSHWFFHISFEIGAGRARSCGEVEVPALPHQAQSGLSPSCAL